MNTGRDLNPGTQPREAWLGSFPEANPNPILEISLDGQLAYLNPAIRKLFPSLETDQTNHPYLDGWEELINTFKAQPELVLTREVRVGQDTFQQSIHFAQEYQRLRVYGMIITGAKKMEVTLAAQQAQLEAIIEAQQDIVLLYDPERKVRRANRAFQETYGFDPVGMHVREIIERVDCRTEDGKPLVMEQQPTPQALRGKKISGARYRVRGANGSDLVVQTSSSPLWEGDQITGSVTVWHDITELYQMRQSLEGANTTLQDQAEELEVQTEELRQQAEELRLSQEMFSVAFANNPAAISLTRLDDGLFLNVNETWEAMMGYNRSEVIGRSARKLPIWPTAEAAARFVQELREKGSIRGWEQEFLRRSGEIFMVELSAQLLIVQGEKLILSTFADITRHQQLEQALAKANAYLEQRVKERTTELISAAGELEKALQNEKLMRLQLIEAEKYAALARLVASVAHEINNPLQTVQNSLFLLKSIYGEGKGQELMNMAISESKRISLLVQQLRETYRPAKDLRAVDTNLVNLLKSVSALMQPQFRQNNIEIQMQCEGQEELHVQAIPDQLKQVFINICLNAVDAIGSQGGQIMMNISQPQGNGRACVAIQDSGPGIDPEHLNKIFEPFFTTKPKGTGLGLAICYEIIQDHGGEIKVESEMGKGTTFRVWLPVNHKQ